MRTIVAGIIIDSIVFGVITGHFCLALAALADQKTIGPREWPVNALRVRTDRPPIVTHRL
jgi:hypothetical protein